MLDVACKRERERYIHVVTAKLLSLSLSYVEDFDALVEELAESVEMTNSFLRSPPSNNCTFPESVPSISRSSDNHA